LLRLIAGALLVANLAFFAWTQGWLSPLAMPPMSSEREPERITLQVRPETVTLLGPKAAAEARQAADAASAAGAAASGASATQAASASAAR
jgi:hypothetical protein